jgi:hypothetical protein
MIKEGDFAMTAHGSDEEVHIGQVVHVMTEGMLGVPGGEYSLEATAENPAVLIQLFEQEENGYWEATNLYTGCMMSLMVAIDPLPQEPEDSEVAMAMYDASIGKSSCCPEESSIDKALFADFGKDYTTSQSLTHIFKPEEDGKN